jgi:hypothetical protein
MVSTAQKRYDRDGIGVVTPFILSVTIGKRSNLWLCHVHSDAWRQAMLTLVHECRD